ncbi:MAG TPA: ribulose-phosphate 3-epimerase [Ignavibacteria bacterium]|nr:ribulose-phosphate 3-epimerase [Ignavibacteria bacterium]HRJ98041.1 ribulose-phosphate 3-epimerase [Ignavibacteria bacterium]
MKKILPSILSADFSRLGEEIREAESCGADMIHCDIMDGRFVPNISFGPKVISDVNKVTDLPLDVHLMIENPENFIDEFYKAGADMISVHYENNYHLDRVLQQIKSHGIKAGAVLNPATPVSSLENVLYNADYVLLMSVNPGFGGQKFIENTLRKIGELKEIIIKNGYNTEIEVDGGVDLTNIKSISDAGADMFVCGSSIFNSEDKCAVIKKMKSLIGN